MKTVECKEMTLLPPRKDLCQECAAKHSTEQPHNKDSLYYQTKFQMENKRSATWEDAMAHCSEEAKKTWIEELQKCNVRIN